MQKNKNSLPTIKNVSHNKMKLILFICSNQSIPKNIIDGVNQIIATHFENTTDQNQNDDKIFQQIINNEYKKLTGIKRIPLPMHTIKKFLFYNVNAKFDPFFKNRSISYDDKLTILEGYLGHYIQQHSQLSLVLSLIPRPHGITDGYSFYSIGLVYNYLFQRQIQIQNYKKRLPKEYKNLFQK